MRAALCSSQKAEAKSWSSDNRSRVAIGLTAPCCWFDQAQATAAFTLEDDLGYAVFNGLPCPLPTRHSRVPNCARYPFSNARSCSLDPGSHHWSPSKLLRVNRNNVDICESFAITGRAIEAF
jgi:hypothetical protein